MKKTLLILLIIICFFGCNDDITSDISSVNSLKVYDFDVQRVKKIHNLFALIDTTTVLVLDENGEKAFDISNLEYNQEETISFKFTDVVAGSNNDIFILGAEILKDKTFQIYVFKFNEKGQMVWNKPIIIPITNDYNEKIIEKFYFFISHNGYAFGCFNDNKIFLVVNYQSGSDFKCYYKLIALDDSGSVLIESEPKEESHPEIWTFNIDFLPNGNIITSHAVGNRASINQFDSNTFELRNGTLLTKDDIDAYLPIFTNMLTLNSEEVIFTGHADKEDGPINGANFDAFLLKFNTIENMVTDTIFFGVKSNFELTFHSLFDIDGNVRCIGTKRNDNVLNHTTESSLYEINFNLNSKSSDFLILIQNKGYEGLYFELEENTGFVKVLGSKLDISGRQNKQAFFTIIKP